ncbi:hypothetical protein [Haloferula sp.]
MWRASLEAACDQDRMLVDLEGVRQVLFGWHAVPEEGHGLSELVPR